jgi:hypothetical protein
MNLDAKFSRLRRRRRRVVVVRFLGGGIFFGSRRGEW